MLIVLTNAIGKFAIVADKLKTFFFVNLIVSVVSNDNSIQVSKYYYYFCSLELPINIIIVKLKCTYNVNDIV